MFRFTIRDLLWLMAVVGLAVALWIEHRTRSSAKLRALKLEGTFEVERLVWDGVTKELSKENREIGVWPDGTVQFFPQGQKPMGYDVRQFIGLSPPDPPKSTANEP